VPSNTLRRCASWALPIAAIVLLNASLTFGNIWPTPGIRWQGQVSLELAGCILLLAVWHRSMGPPSRRAIAGLALIWLFLVIGHYGDVTAPALYGRRINLYWDSQHLSNVGAMLARVATWPQIAGAAAAALAAALLLFVAARWALGQLSTVIGRPLPRAVLCVLAVVVTVGYAIFHQPIDATTKNETAFAAPVTQTYARQAALVAEALLPGDAVRLGASPPMHPDLQGLAGADVVLMFMESYGAVTYERPELAAELAAPRAALAEAVRASGRSVVSAYVESPTFGGSSWLAHISLMSGVEVRDQFANALLMTERRETIGTAFARQGYRIVALMPGLRQEWPEGAFYGFDEIYTKKTLDYHGPSFGWWSIPDQYSLAALDARELNGRQPRFVFYPTTSTHAPFGPVAPYQPDWARMLTDTPFDAPAVDASFADPPDLTNLGPSYARAVAYEYETLAGFLGEHAGDDTVLIVLGDHQPPAAVSGEGAPWDVPVHVIARQPGVLAHMRASGFGDGLTPVRPSLGPMHALLPVLLDAFSLQLKTED
jgi:hypothetical protein